MESIALDTWQFFFSRFKVFPGIKFSRNRHFPLRGMSFNRGGFNHLASRHGRYQNERPGGKGYQPGIKWGVVIAYAVIIYLHNSRFISLLSPRRGLQEGSPPRVCGLQVFNRVSNRTNGNTCWRLMNKLNIMARCHQQRTRSNRLSNEIYSR